MALIPDRKSTVEAVGIIIKTDDTIEKLLFPKRTTHKTKEITYDMATVEGETVEFNSFSNTSNTIEKDGKTIVTLNVINLNNSISKDEIDANVLKFGEGDCGIGNVDVVMEEALNGIGRIRLYHLATSKKTMYEALTTHRIVKGYESPTGPMDIVFPVPTANKRVLDGVTAGQIYWSVTATSTPLTNIIEAYNTMKVKASYVIMNQTTFSNFTKATEVITSNANLDGKRRNFKENENIEPASEAYYAGQINESGVILDVYVEKQVRSDTNPFMPTEYVVLTSGIGEINFGGIPVAEEGVGVHNIKAEWTADHIVLKDPATNKIVVKTAPLHTLKNGEGYYSIRVEA